MTLLTPAQRNLLYMQEAARTGVHKPILAALHQVQQQPHLSDGDTGLGISPINRIGLAAVNSFTGQVFYAANTLRSLTHHLIQTGWKPADLWHSQQGCYSERFLRAIAKGYIAPASDTAAALLEGCQFDGLLQSYQQDQNADTKLAPVSDQSFLDQALQEFVRQVSEHYWGLSHQRFALLELIRLWYQVDTQDEAIATLALSFDAAIINSDQTALDAALRQFVAQISAQYEGYPHQREAFLRFTQLWRQLALRQMAIATLLVNPSAHLNSSFVDPALIEFVQRIPQIYQSSAAQRHALVEGFRLWRQLDTRSDALIALGLGADTFTSPCDLDFTQAAMQVDRALLEFVQLLPTAYQGLPHQRHALLHLTQLWRGIASSDLTIQGLFNDLKRLENISPAASDAPIPPIPTPPPRPTIWTPTNLQLDAAILPNSSLTWADVTLGGLHLPTNQTTIDAVLQIAALAQQIRYRLGQALRVVRWYEPQASHHPMGERYEIGDAIAFYCIGLTSDQIYWFLDPWWMGGLGRYNTCLCYVDADLHRVRWSV